MPTKTLCVLGLEWLLARRPAVFPTASEKVFAVKSAALARSATARTMNFGTLITLAD